MVTQTKQKLLMQMLRQHADDKGVVAHDALTRFSSRHHVPMGELRSLVEQAGYMPEAGLKKQPVTRRAVPLSDKIKKDILDASIYKELSPQEPHESDSEVFVVTTLAQLKREREAIRRWIKELGGKLP